ncbi:nitrilase-related carbon-nitrogen hydrolase [Streptomyces albidocamelliae]|uniref:CN hydrolase domain-containing protein n=2 Tax=Streptomyces TaxID=1883 RepID=A0ABY6ESY1_9ACTN|nr:nitrilase-related carbon-nitrogen hydrolase [Streptomyces sp. HUAS 14-6]UXY37509.1 hypothetical protein N8I86_23955 [Streptomyces sp. HUAS 14-6]
MRASLIQLSVDASESAAERRLRAAFLVRDRAGDHLVALPELWVAGAWSYDRWERDAEGIDGPTAEATSAAARRAGVRLHAGSVVGRDGDGTLYNTALLVYRAGEQRGRYRKIHRYGFDTGEATVMGGGDDIVTVPPGVRRDRPRHLLRPPLSRTLPRTPNSSAGCSTRARSWSCRPPGPPPASPTSNSSPAPGSWRNRRGPGAPVNPCRRTVRTVRRPAAAVPSRPSCRRGCTGCPSVP